MQNHAELDAYLNAHPDVQAELMADPQSFVHGAQRFDNASVSGTTGVSGRGTGMTGTSTGSMTGNSTNPASTTPKLPKPKL